MQSSDIAGVRLIPNLIEFKDVQPGIRYKQNLVVQNISANSKKIRFYEPENKAIRVLVKNPDNLVAPGLEVPAIVEYFSDETDDTKCDIAIQSDLDLVHISIFVYKPQCFLSISNAIDFGNVVDNSKVVSKEILIMNAGSLAGDYKINYIGKCPITISPSSGTVPPRSDLTIKVDFVAKIEGPFMEKAKVFLEGHEPYFITISGNVVKHSLEILDFQTHEPTSCVKFGCAYYGTDNTVPVILFNNGPDEVDFVAVLDEGAEGEEAGVDLTKSTAATLAAKGMDKMRGTTNELTALITALPNFGKISPYEKRVVFFKFSPRFRSEMSGWKGSNIPPPRQDYVLFMYFDLIGSRSLLAEEIGEQRHFPRVELAMVGTALPILVTLMPHLRYDFGECSVGEKVEIQCCLKNESDTLPSTFFFKSLAHFSSSPNHGFITPLNSQDITLRFTPNQIGNFRPTQLVEILGPVFCGDISQPDKYEMRSIHTIYIPLTGESKPVTKKQSRRYNPGIVPEITNEVGIRGETSQSELKPFHPRAAVLDAPRSAKKHSIKHSKKTNPEETLVAFPNDRSYSIRPTDSNFKTLFTQRDRHHYVDPDYTYSEKDLAKIRKHKQQYIDFIQQHRKQRILDAENQEYLQLNNLTDIGIRPGRGLRPPKPHILELKEDMNASYNKRKDALSQKNKLLSIKNLSEIERKALQLEVVDGLNAAPLTEQEKIETSQMLDAQELRHVVIGPPSIDFGEVCLRSTNTKDLIIANNLNCCIYVNVNVDCRELRQTSLLSQVVPANSKAKLPLIFESNTKGRFQRNISYTINGHHQNHILVYADVVPVALELSTDCVVLRPTHGAAAEAGFRETITLINNRNYQAEFTWSPIIGEKGTAFSIRPANGFVEAYQELDCEVVFHPSYVAPDEGNFILQVHAGNTIQLKCVAKFGQPQVQFIDRRVLFENVALNMTTERTAVLYNPSAHHAYFQVVDPNPFPGLQIAPYQGIVPVGGSAQFTVSLTPTQVIKFDSHLMVSFRNWKTLDLRIGGVVEPPLVDIDIKSFKLGGVYCGSASITPFKLTNKATSQARVEFDLSMYNDFSIKVISSSGSCSLSEQQGRYFSIILNENEELDCELEFKPTEVASYDFILPVSINETMAPTPASTPFPQTPASSVHTIGAQPRVIPHTIVTPRRRIVATALRQPLQISRFDLHFDLTDDQLSSAEQTVVLQSKSIANIVKWHTRIDSEFFFINDTKKEIDGVLRPKETIEISLKFVSDKFGEFSSKLPIYVNDDDAPFRTLNLMGLKLQPVLSFLPSMLDLTPVPLGVEVSKDFHILSNNYSKGSELKFVFPDVFSLDGEKTDCLQLRFPNENSIPANESDKAIVINCQVLFMSEKPISFATDIIFQDEFGGTFKLPITASCDNSLLTCYPFLAKNRNNHKICTQQGQTLRGLKSQSKESLDVGDPMILSAPSPNHMSGSGRSSSTSTFNANNSYEDSNSFTGSTYPSTPHEGLVLHAMQNLMKSEGFQLVSTNLAADPEERVFYAEVVQALRRWFSQHGWAGGPYPISIPETLRSNINKTQKQTSDVRKSNKQTPDINSSRKDIKTVLEMFFNLTGRTIPGISASQPLPQNPTDRMWSLYGQHRIFINYLKTQGAMLSAVKPEYLLEPHDYHRYRQLNASSSPSLMRKTLSQVGSDENNSDEDHFQQKGYDEFVFEQVSVRAWSDILLQLYKLYVLGRINPRSFRLQPSPRRDCTLPNVNPDPNCSNIYSVGERILLAWLNHHYEHERASIWEGNDRGGVPPTRWVVNFDLDLLDGLVIAAVLGSFCPFLIDTHIKRMYTRPTTAEQCLHNALNISNAFRFIGLDYDIQAIDLTDPNPVTLLMLTAFLYETLPQYLPRSNVEFIGSLHQTVTRQVKISNPSSKTVVYYCFIAGKDREDFTLQRGQTITVPGKSSTNVIIEFKSRFLRAAQAVLCLASRNYGGGGLGSTLVFNLVTTVNSVVPMETVRSESPCYEIQKINMKVTNPFKHSGDFKIILVESPESILPMFNAQKSQESGGSKPSRSSFKDIKARTDHGQPRAESSPLLHPDTPEYIVEDEEMLKSLPYAWAKLLRAQKPKGLNSFYCSSKSISIAAGATEFVEILFLPFYEGKKPCSVVFINENIGEFIYFIEAIASLPLPQPVPFFKSEQSNRITSAAAANGSQGIYGGDDRVVYLRCEAKRDVKEVLQIPITNIARENALVVAAQQMMTKKEFDRRMLTGTLASGSVTAAVASLAEPADTTKKKSRLLAQMTLNPEGTDFSVESTSAFFKVPKSLFIPHPINEGLKRKRHTSAEIIPQNLKDLGLNLDDGTVSLPVKFKAASVGHYPCRVILRSANDIRVYHLEVSVSPEGTTATLEFTSPAQQHIVQDIPIINNTPTNWYLQAFLKGDAFSGPQTLVSRSNQTTFYPLVFKPNFEGPTDGLLRLVNKTDGMEHVFSLKGFGERPLALDHITVNCTVKRRTGYMIKVPNATNRKLTFKILSDCSFISGLDNVTVLPQKEQLCEIFVTPIKRGFFKAILSFVAKDQGRNVDDNTSHITLPQTKGNLMSIANSNSELPDSDNPIYQIWFSLEINVAPAVPEKTLILESKVFKSTALECDITNPTDEEMKFDVKIEGSGLSGQDCIVLAAKETSPYRVIFNPSRAGKSTGAIIFSNDVVGEFWYALDLSAYAPESTVLPHLQCSLGQWVRQFIKLENTTSEGFELKPSSSNSNNFTLEAIDSSNIIRVPACSTLEVPLLFTPSCLGQGNHFSRISFYSTLFGEWTFSASGTGLLPKGIDPITIYCDINTNTSIILPFRNPTDEMVLVDIMLTSKEDEIPKNTRLRHSFDEEASFCLLLKQTRNVKLAPRHTLDIPISYAPDSMKLSDAICCVSIRKPNGQQWEVMSPTHGPEHSFTLNIDQEDLREIRWHFPIHGIPESLSPSSCTLSLECEARNRVEEEIQVTLTGVVSTTSGPSVQGSLKSLDSDGTDEAFFQDGVVLTDVNAIAEEFSHELVFGSKESQKRLENSLVISLRRRVKDKSTGLVSLIFCVIFAPSKPLEDVVYLVIKSATGGIWKFPLKLNAIEPPDDDQIEIASVGLNKDAVASIRLCSQSDKAVEYKAYFIQGSDTELSVIPRTGQLLPKNADGTRILILFRPTTYGKNYKGKLVVQTENCQWTYVVKGVLPEFEPPVGVSARPMAGPHKLLPIKNRYRNYIRENLNIETTAVSSPIKGAPIFQRSFTKF